MTLVLIGKGLLLEGSNPKIEDIQQVPGIYIYIFYFGHSKRGFLMDFYLPFITRKQNHLVGPFQLGEKLDDNVPLYRCNKILIPMNYSNMHKTHHGFFLFWCHLSLTIVYIITWMSQEVCEWLVNGL